MRVKNFLLIKLIHKLILIRNYVILIIIDIIAILF